MHTFRGTMTLDDGEQIAVDLELDEQSLTLRTDGALIGAWPVKYCRVARSGRGAVLLSIDGEKVVFEPDDLPLFATTAAKQFRASSLADRVAVVRDIAVADAPERSRSRAEARGEPDGERIAQLWRWSVPIVAAAGLIVLAGLAMRWVDAQGPSVTTTTLATTIVTAPPLFDQTVEQFTDEWNLVAVTFGVPIQIGDVLVPGQFEARLTPFLTMQGRTDPDGTIGSIILVIDPSGETGEDQLALAALGVALTVANPELGREGRAEVLDRLGLSVQDPDLADLDGAAEVGETAYTIRYIDEFGALLFTINQR